ncbi:MAG: Rho termination factor N-terminal domain-containing protein [Actinomycetota bacterium]|nr:Rho termination factor N-terminal domain-containing protein [Actinomycetota bacterium]
MTRKQKAAARRNVKKAQSAARRKKTISRLPAEVKRDLGREGAKAVRRGGKPGRSLDERTRAELMDRARELGIKGRSKMGKGELIEALRRRNG